MEDVEIDEVVDQPGVERRAEALLQLVSCRPLREECGQLSGARVLEENGLAGPPGQHQPALADPVVHVGIECEPRIDAGVAGSSWRRDRSRATLSAHRNFLLSQVWEVGGEGSSVAFRTGLSLAAVPLEVRLRRISDPATYAAGQPVEFADHESPPSGLRGR
ncbi:hypothetical protein LV457_08155 [Mycobacterium sp. MYCO198283]|uniref:hypothetical protein n=1 Tax=Mycobacterium sp. MYCO198283 TaxID=2883505 RepID=UPI001E2E913F|nr:hypothetical protein [Mycobacterium sp. MYCO198283]MCG5432265.1 hypothetical protein [Mycobacterium sp. MYCO198283]